MSDENDLCVECAKIGVQSKIRKYNVDFEDTVSLCDNEMCLFPFEVPRLCNALVKDSPNLQNSGCVNNSVDFNIIDSLLDTPIDESDQLSNLMNLLNDDASQKIQLSSTGMVSLSESPTVNPNITDSKLSHIKTDKNPKDCIQRVYSKQELIKEKPPRKFTNNKSKNNETVLLKKPIKSPATGFGSLANGKTSTRPLQQKNRTNFKKFQLEQNNIFSFLKDNLSVNRKRSKPAKSKASKKREVPNQKVEVDSNHLVRHWLNKESPRRAFPGYGVKPTISLAGTSDGRSVTDSIPPSPASLC